MAKGNSVWYMVKFYFQYTLTSILLLILLVACDIQNAQQTNLPAQIAQTTTPITLSTLNSQTGVSIPTATTNNTSTIDQAPNWLRDIPCKMPCFEGIIPEQTSTLEVKTLADRDHRLRYIKTTDGGAGLGNALVLETDENTIFANFDDSIDSNAFAKNIVYRLRIAPRTPIHFSDILAKFGSPDFVETQRWPSTPTPYRFNAYFIHSGFLITRQWAQKSSINANITFEYMIVFAPSEAGLRKVASIDSSTKRIPWQGYQDFDFYCTSSSPWPCT